MLAVFVSFVQQQVNRWSAHSINGAMWENNWLSNGHRTMKASAVTAALLTFCFAMRSVDTDRYTENRECETHTVFGLKWMNHPLRAQTINSKRYRYTSKTDTRFIAYLFFWNWINFSKEFTLSYDGLKHNSKHLLLIVKTKAVEGKRRTLSFYLKSSQAQSLTNADSLSELPLEKKYPYRKQNESSAEKLWLGIS